MQLVHRVGVLFHASDRLSNSMKGIGERFTKLTEKQKMFERAQKEAMRTEQQAAQMRQKNAALEKRIGQQSIQQERLNMRERQTMHDLEQKHKEAMLQRFALVTDKQMEYERKLTQVTADQSAKRQAIASKMRANMAALDARNGARNIVTGNALTGMQRQRDNLLGRNQRVLSSAELAASQARIVANARNVEILRARQAAAVDRSRARAITAGLNPIQTSRAVARASNVYGSQIASIEKLSAAEDRRIQQHYKLVELNQKIVQQELLIAEEIAEQTAAVETLRREQTTAYKQIAVEHRALRDAQRTANAQEFAELERNSIARIAGIEREIELKEHAFKLDRQQHAAKMTALAEEKTAMQGTIAAIDAQAVGQAKNLALMERQVLAAKALQERLGVSAALLSSGMGNLATGAMTLGVLGYAGNHLVHQGAEVQQQKIELRQALASKPGIANNLISQVDKSNGILPNGIRMTSSEQLHLLQDQISAGILPQHAGENLGVMARMIQLQTLKNGGKTPKNIGMDLATLHESLGLLDPTRIENFDNRLAKGMAVSKRLTVKSMRDIAAKSAPIMREMGLRPDDVGFYAAALSSNASGSQLSTQMSNLLLGLSRGGTNKPSRALLDIMSEEGWLKRGSKPTPLMMNGKPYLDPASGKPVILPGSVSFNNLTPTQMMSKLRSGLLAKAGVDPKRFYSVLNNQSQMLPTERARLTQLTQSLTTTKSGSQLLTEFMDPVRIAAAKREQGLVKGAPGLSGQLAGFDKSYNLGLLNLNKSVGQLGVNLGTALLPHMRIFIKDVTWLTDGLSKFAKDHPRRVGAIFELVKWFGILTMGMGALKIGMAAVNLLVPGFARKLAGSWLKEIGLRISAPVMGRIFGDALAGNAVQTAASGGVRSLFATALGSVGVQAVAVAGSVLIAGWLIGGIIEYLDKNKALFKAGIVDDPLKIAPKLTPGVNPSKGIGTGVGGAPNRLITPDPSTSRWSSVSQKDVNPAFLVPPQPLQEMYRAPVQPPVGQSSNGGTMRLEVIHKFEGSPPPGVSTSRVEKGIVDATKKSLVAYSPNTPKPTVRGRS